MEFILSLAAIGVSKATCARCVSVCLSSALLTSNSGAFLRQNSFFLPLNSKNLCTCAPQKSVDTRKLFRQAIQFSRTPCQLPQTSGSFRVQTMQATSTYNPHGVGRWKLSFFTPEDNCLHSVLGFIVCIEGSESNILPHELHQVGLSSLLINGFY